MVNNMRAYICRDQCPRCPEEDGKLLRHGNRRVGSIQRATSVALFLLFIHGIIIQRPLNNDSIANFSVYFSFVEIGVLVCDTTCISN